MRTLELFDEAQAQPQPKSDDFHGNAIAKQKRKSSKAKGRKAKGDGANGDANGDRKLDFEEFKKAMQQKVEKKELPQMSGYPI